MLPSRPVIFISAVSKELRSTRDLVAKTLLGMGYEPKWQDIAPTETGDLPAVLRKWVDESHAVLQIVGHRYGNAPKEPDETFGPVSYTQYEALYAHAKGKKVWYIILDPHHPTDPADPEPETLKLLQAAYRAQVKAHQGLYHHSYSLDKTEIIVLRLRDDLAELRTAAVKTQKRQDEALAHLHEQNKLLLDQNQTLLAAVRDLPAAFAAAQQTNPQADKITQLAGAYASLDESFGLAPGTLEKELPAFAQNLLAAPDTSLIDKANAEFVLKNYRTAEKLALKAKDAALAAASQPVQDAIAALQLAGQAASEQIQYRRALEHYRAAAALTGEQSDVLAWAAIQNEIGWLLYLDGKYNDQAELMHYVWQSCAAAGHSEHPSTFRARHQFASALVDQGKPAEAEPIHRAILACSERNFGPAHAATLASRSNLALALHYQGKHAEAEQEHKAVLVIRERVLGSKHPDTLSCRSNIAVTMRSQGKYAEAEAENRAVLAIRERVLGPEHPDTLNSRNNLANALFSQGKHVEAEEEHRAVLHVRERLLGPEHPEVLKSRMNVANTLLAQFKYAEAETEQRAVLAIKERVLGPEHPDTLGSRNNLANALDEQGKHAEAETEHRAVLSTKELVLGPEHPDTLSSCYNLCRTLEKLGRKEEALALARRASVGLNQVLGNNHPNSHNANRCVEWLENK